MALSLSRKDILDLFDVIGTINMIVCKVGARPNILSAQNAYMTISKDISIEIRSSEVGFSRGAEFIPCVGCSPYSETRDKAYVPSPTALIYFTSRAIEGMIRLPPVELVRVLDQWSLIGPWLDSLAADPDPAADLEAEDYLRARLAAARLS